MTSGSNHGHGGQLLTHVTINTDVQRTKRNTLFSQLCLIKATILFLNSIPSKLLTVPTGPPEDNLAALFERQKKANKYFRFRCFVSCVYQPTHQSYGSWGLNVGWKQPEQRHPDLLQLTQQNLKAFPGQSLQRVLGLSQGLGPVGRARSSSPGRHR